VAAADDRDAVREGNKMKIAVTAAGKGIESDVDPRFGRALYILIFDENGSLLEAVDNSENSNAMRGAGIYAGKILADKNVNVLITGACGPNAFKTLKAAGINVVVEQSGKVREALDRFNKHETQFADQPNVEAHW
jgi:predicted Fe-Mo cluster-binding NifX family protein